jgi:hypothetical protein
LEVVLGESTVVVVLVVVVGGGGGGGGGGLVVVVVLGCWCWWCWWWCWCWGVGVGGGGVTGHLEGGEGRVDVEGDKEAEPGGTEEAMSKGCNLSVHTLVNLSIS